MELSNQEDVFNILHDGVLIDIQKDQKDIFLTIEISYLAKIINPNYEFFKIKLENCSSFRFWSWDNKINKSIGEIEKIKDLDLQISGGKVEEDILKVICYCDGEHELYPGGEISISCDNIQIFDEEGHEISLIKFAVICSSYWNRN